MNVYIAQLAARRFVIHTLRANEALCPKTAIRDSQIASIVVGPPAHAGDINPILESLDHIGHARCIVEGATTRWYLTDKGIRH